MSSFQAFCLAQDLLDDFMLLAHLTITILQMDFVSLSYFRHQDNEINIFLATTGIFNVEIPSQTQYLCCEAPYLLQICFAHCKVSDSIRMRESAALSLVHTNNH